MEHQIADTSDVFALAEADDDQELDLTGEESDDEFDDVVRYDGWSEGDEEATWR